LLTKVNFIIITTFKILRGYSQTIWGIYIAPSLLGSGPWAVWALALITGPSHIHSDVTLK